MLNLSVFMVYSIALLACEHSRLSLLLAAASSYIVGETAVFAGYCPFRKKKKTNKTKTKYHEQSLGPIA